MGRVEVRVVGDQIDEYEQEKQAGQHQHNALNGLQLLQLIGIEVEVLTGRRRVPVHRHSDMREGY
jgi:hypothetical protein